MHKRGSRFATLAILAARAALSAAGSGSGISPTPDGSFLIPWGQGEAELGFRAGPEMEPLCVQTWCLAPGGTFLLLDPVARRVKEYGSDGGWIRSWGKDVVGSSLACDADGVPFVLDGAELLRVPPASRPESWIRLPAPVLPGYGQGIRGAGGDGLVVTDRGRVRYIVCGMGRDRSVAETPDEGVRIERGRGRVAATRDGVSVELGEAAGTVLPVATQANGAEIVEVERRMSDGAWRLEVWFLNGATASRVVDTGPCDDVSVLYRRVAVAQDGTVYRARTTSDGFEILLFGSKPEAGR